MTVFDFAVIGLCIVAALELLLLAAALPVLLYQGAARPPLTGKGWASGG